MVDINKTFRWNYTDHNGISHSWHWVIKVPGELYEYFHHLPHDVYGWEDYIKFVTDQADESFFGGIARSLTNGARSYGYNQVETAEWVLNMVRSIPYAPDPEPNKDWPRYPIETLWESTGDCEDAAILTAKLWKSMGFDVALLAMIDIQHMAVGINIALPSVIYPSPLYFPFNGKKYYYAEAAGSLERPFEARIGEISTEWSRSRAIVLPVPVRSEIYKSVPQKKQRTYVDTTVKPYTPSKLEEDGVSFLLGCLLWLVILAGILWFVWTHFIHSSVSSSRSVSAPHVTAVVSTPAAPTSKAPASHLAQQKDNTYRWVTAHPRLRVRSGPGTSYKITGHLAYGERVKVDHYNADKSWAYITEPYQGWVSAAYLSSTSPNLCIQGQLDRFEKQPNPLNEIWGRVLDLSGRPIAGWKLEVYVPHYEDRFRVPTMSQKDGSFYWAGLTPQNEYGVRVVDVPYKLLEPVIFRYTGWHQRAIITFRVKVCP